MIKFKDLEFKNIIPDYPNRLTAKVKFDNKYAVAITSENDKYELAVFHNNELIIHDNEFIAIYYSEEEINELLELIQNYE